MLFDVVVVVVVVKVGMSIPALLLGFLYYVQVGTLLTVIVFRLEVELLWVELQIGVIYR